MRCSDDEIRLTNENENLRFLLEQELKSASELDTAEKLQRIVLEELHQRVKNMLTTVQAITLRSIQSADSLEHAVHAVESRLLAYSRVQDLLLRTSRSGAAALAPARSLRDPGAPAGYRYDRAC